MKRKRVNCILGIFSMLVLILDSKTALTGAYEGIQLCLRTVIPALFPFFIVSLLLTSSLAGANISLLRPLSTLLQIPQGSEIYFLTGLLSGYPAGAQSIAYACKNGQMDPKDAGRMISFCNNAGPAFIFGIGMLLFDRLWICFLVWAIQIASALITGIFSRKQVRQEKVNASSVPMTVTAALKQSLEAISMVCGWVIAFRVIQSLLERWCFWWLPQIGQLMISGILEISNGSIALTSVAPMGLRFSLFSAFLAFGGCCVSMQTFSVLSDVNISRNQYISAKITQSSLALMLSFAAQFLFPAEVRYLPHVFLPILCLAVILLDLMMQKKYNFSVDFLLPMVYNKEKN